MVKRRRKQSAVYLEDVVKDLAKQRAKEKGMTFSSYLQRLILDDLGFILVEEKRNILITTDEDGVEHYDVVRSENVN